MVRNRPAPISDPGIFNSAPPTVGKEDSSEIGLPPKAQTVGEFNTLPVKNTFVDFGSSSQCDFENGTSTAPGKFVGRLAGTSFVSGSTAPNTPAGIGRPCVAMISGSEERTRTVKQAEVLSVTVGQPGVFMGPGAPPPPMHSPHIPTMPADITGESRTPPSRPPLVKPMQMCLSNAIPPPAPEAFAAVAKLAPPVMAPPMVPQQMPAMRQQLEAGSLIEVKPMQAGTAPGALPRFAPPSYAMGYNLQTPVGASPPIGPPMFTPSCSTPSGRKVNGLLSASLASSVQPTPTGIAWPPTPNAF